MSNELRAHAHVHEWASGPCGGGKVERRVAMTGERRRTLGVVCRMVGSLLVGGALWLGCSPTTESAGQAVNTCGNPIACENLKQGNSDWDVLIESDATCGLRPAPGRPTSCISGFSTDISVNIGATISFKVDTDSDTNSHTTNWVLDIYRLGYYGGAGARKVGTATQVPNVLAHQPPCNRDPTGAVIVDCANWQVSATWTVPSSAVSGVYVGKLKRRDVAGSEPASHITFIVRDDNGASASSDILFQTSDTTWQAYNGSFDGLAPYGLSLYNGAIRVSYDRPFTTRHDLGLSWFRHSEYAMLRWLERNGYDVSYTTGVDTDRRGDRILSHKVFLSVGHDEYWSAQQRANVEAARDAGVHLAFFSGNEVFWKTMWEGSSRRALVTRKETYGDRQIPRRDAPGEPWTGTWRDPSLYPPAADAGKPENALTGTMFMVEGPASYASLEIPAAQGKLRFWRHINQVNNMSAGQVAVISGCIDVPFRTLNGPSDPNNPVPGALVGYEWDEDLDNGFRPPGLMQLSTTTRTLQGSPRMIVDHGVTPRPGISTHHMTLYRHTVHPPDRRPSLVFGAGTINWPWGLDPNRDTQTLPDRVPTMYPRSRSSYTTGDGQSARGHGRATGDAATRAACCIHINR